MKKFVGILCSTLLLLCLGSCSKKAEKGEFTIEKGVFKVGMEIGYPPMEYYDTDGKTPYNIIEEIQKRIAENA